MLTLTDTCAQSRQRNRNSNT